jgi:4-hydroxythreonine-4-phosphate dehydrogenase
VTTLALTLGDPRGIGPEITAKAWRRLVAEGGPHFAVYAPDNLAEENFASYPSVVISEPSEAAEAFAHGLPILPFAATASINEAIVQSIRLAALDALKGRVRGVVTNPIAKAALYETGFSHPGHTEFLGAICREETGQDAHPVMMLSAGDLRVALATIHVPLKEVSTVLTTVKIVETAKALDHGLKQGFGIKRPSIAIAALNPHAGEDGTIGREEAEIIAPAIAELRALGVEVSGPYPADTLFHAEARERHDGVVAMYHDQGLIPIKMLDFWRGVNTTLGLPFVRTSPDHGTAFDIAGKGIARPDSLLAAIFLADRMARQRNRFGA